MAIVERSVRRVETPEAQTAQTVQRGPFHAVVIGIDQYASLPALSTAVHDAEAVEAVLRERYNFKTELLRNPTRYEILSALNRYRTTLPENANLLIYYAGHGYFDKEADKELRKSIRTAALKVAAEAAASAPRRSGALAKSIRPYVSGAKASIGSTLPYAGVVHWGGTIHPRGVDIKFPRTEFITKAVARHTDQIVDDIGDGIERAALRAGWH